MRCRRCGFELDEEARCPLCTAPVDLARPRTDRAGSGYPMVLCCNGLPEQARPELAALARGQAASGAGRRRREWFLFDLAEVDRFLQAIELVRASASWEVILDGRPRPYGRELWLPLLALFQGTAEN